MNANAIARIVAVAWGFGCATPCMGQDSGSTTDSSFTLTFFEPMVISSLGVRPERIAQLGRAEVQALTAARSTLGEFFKSVEDPKGNPLQFMTPAYIARKPDRVAVIGSLTQPEWTILQIGVTDYQLAVDGTSVDLSFYWLQQGEGLFEVGKAKAVLRKTGTAWKVDKVSPDQ